MLRHREEQLAKRKSHRLRDYDYSSNGYYFVTICTNRRRAILSRIVGNDALVVPTKIGAMVLESWLKIGELNEGIDIDQYVLMPNHIHGIIIIEQSQDTAADHIAVNTIKKHGFEISERRGRRSLQGVIRDFKSVTTRHYINMTKNHESLWQKSFHDHIIRNEQSYRDIWHYIKHNPHGWPNDRYYVE